MDREKDKRYQGRVDTPTAEAADWVARLNNEAESDKTQAELDGWLARDPANPAEFAALSDIWDRFDELADHPLVRKEISLAPAAGDRLRRWFGRLFPAAPAFAPAAALAGVLLIVAVIWGVQEFNRPAPMVTYQTRTGEQKTVSLEDGSKVFLDTATTIAAQYEKGGRRVDLLAGRAQFSVRRDASRPFTVSAGQTRVRVLGTVFDVFKRDEGRIVVSVLKGRVRVSQAEGSSSHDTVPSQEPKFPKSAWLPEKILGSGDQIVVDEAHAAFALQQADIKTLTTWAAGKFDFRMAPLKEIIPEVNRYLEHPIRIDEPDLNEVRISLYFDRSDAGLFLDTLEKTLPVTVSRLPDGTVVLAGRK